jgi:hypothetical protein
LLAAKPQAAAAGGGCAEGNQGDKGSKPKAKGGAKGKGNGKGRR